MCILRATMTTESSAERFRRLASKRTNTVLEKIRILGNCANRGMYSYTDEEVQKIFGIIEKELKDTKSKFAPKRARKFSL